MLNKKNRERYKRIKYLDKNQKELYELFKDIFFQKKCNGNKIDKNVQEKIKDLIFSSSDFLEFSVIRDNTHNISYNIPYEEEGKDINQVFVELLNIIKKKNIGLENKHFFDEPSIFTVLKNVENITNNLDKIDQGRIFGLLKSNSDKEKDKYKAKIAIKFLISFSVLKEKEIIENSIFILIGENYNKIRVLETLIDKYESHIINNEIIRMVLKSVMYESNDMNINNINKIINKIFTHNQDENNYLHDNMYLIKNIIQKIKEYSSNPNIDIITDLIDYKFISINKEIQYNIIDKTAEMKFSGEEHIKLYKKIVNNILTDSKNYNVVNYYLTKINEVESLKSLEMLLDLYPFMCKHTRSSHNLIFEQISDLNNLEVMNLDDNTKRKKLVIPIFTNEGE